jgi:anti-sigma factor RsiW
MRCEKARRWISDRLDGALPPDKARRLETHAADCPACRSYEGKLLALQSAAAGKPEAGPDADYFAASLRRLRTRLEDGGEPSRPLRRPVPVRPRRWAWAGAAGLLAAAAGIYFALISGGRIREAYGPAHTDALLAIDQAASEDPGLAADLESDLRASIRESGGTVRRESVNPAVDTLIFVEGLADEDVRLLDDEIRRQIRL